MKAWNRGVRIAGGTVAGALLTGLVACGQVDPAADDAPEPIAQSSESAPVVAAASTAAVISQEQLLAALEEGTAPILLDVRTAEEFNEGHIEGAINIPFDELPQRAAEIGAETDAPIVLYCRTGRRVRIAETALAEVGYSNLIDLEGHIQEWKAAGLPLVSVETD